MNPAEHEYFENMYRKYSDMVYRIALMYTKNISDAEDIMEDIFVKLMEKKPVFNDENHEKAWTIHTTVNMCKNLVKSAWFKRSDFDEKLYEYCTTENDIRLMDDIMTMPPKYRCVIYLYYYEGYKSAEIGKMLGIREATVRSRLMRGRQKLKMILDEGGYVNV